MMTKTMIFFVLLLKGEDFSEPPVASTVCHPPPGESSGVAVGDIADDIMFSKR